MIVFSLFEVILCTSVLNNWNHFIGNWWNLFELISSQYLLANINICVTLCSNAILLIISTGLMSIHSFHINLWFQSKILQLKQFQRERFLWYRHIYFKSFLLLIKSSMYYGTIFMIYLAVNFPNNCIFILLLIVTVDYKLKITILVIMFNQFCISVGLHMAFAYYNSRLNIVKMIHKFVPEKSFHFRSNLKMNLFIQAFHTKNDYGITYGIFGNISMLTFFKVC